MRKAEKAKIVREKIDAAVETALAEWNKGDISKYVNNLIKITAEKRIMSMLGVSTAFGKFDVKRESPLYHKIQDTVNEIINEFIFPEPILTDNEKRLLIRMYRTEYMRELKERAAEQGRRDANQDIYDVINELELKDE